jgi:hypothetical protein
MKIEPDKPFCVYVYRDTRLGTIESRLSVLIWAVGANVAATIAAFGMLVTMSGRLGEISGQLNTIAHLLQK